MLIYIDKKKIKRQKIKRTILAFTIILLIILNSYLFQNNLHQTNSSLTEFSTLKTDNEWYYQNQSTHIFSSSQNNKVAILIPQSINKTNSISIAHTFSQIIPNNKTVFFDETIQEKDYLLSIAKIYNPNLQISSSPKNILVSSNFDNLKSFIKDNQLLPSIINTTKINKLTNSSEFLTISDTKFPPQKSPSNNLEKQEQSLIAFKKEYTSFIFSILNGSLDTPFSKKNTLLKNTSICLITKNNQQSCSFNKDKSLINNIINAQKKLPPQNNIDKIILLTSFEEISFSTQSISSNTGLFFEFENRNSILLPNQISNLDINQAISTLKIKANINPTHQQPKMKLYQFKAVEIKLNDNI